LPTSSMTTDFGAQRHLVKEALFLNRHRLLLSFSAQLGDIISIRVKLLKWSTVDIESVLLQDQVTSVYSCSLLAKLRLVVILRWGLEDKPFLLRILTLPIICSFSVKVPDKLLFYSLSVRKLLSSWAKGVLLVLMRRSWWRKEKVVLRVGTFRWRVPEFLSGKLLHLDKALASGNYVFWFIQGLKRTVGFIMQIKLWLLDGVILDILPKWILEKRNRSAWVDHVILQQESSRPDIWRVKPVVTFLNRVSFL
jgi:hypothetical protein